MSVALAACHHHRIIALLAHASVQLQLKLIADVRKCPIVPQTQHDHLYPVRWRSFEVLVSSSCS
jgi:hypothetical protein